MAVALFNSLSACLALLPWAFALFNRAFGNFFSLKVPTPAHFGFQSHDWTFRLTYELRSDNTFVIKSPTITDSGTWVIGANTYLIRFYHPDKIEFTRSLLKMTSAEPSLLFLNGRDTLY